MLMASDRLPKTNVWPSGAALTTCAEPIIPPAPATFSTITCWPRISDMRRAMMRPITSVPPPAPHGTTSVTVRVGQSCADAGLMAAAMSSGAMTTSARVRGMNSSARRRLERLRARHALLRLLHAVIVAHRDRPVRRCGPGGDAGRQAGHDRIVVRMVEEHDRQAARSAFGLLGRVGDAMQGREPAVVGPARHQVALVDHERSRDHRNVVPVPIAVGDLQAADG